MSEIQQLLNEIHGFMGGMNHCYQPKLKGLYEQYMVQCNELADLLQKCRAMRDKGLGADARAFNQKHSPTLTERFTILNIPEREEFAKLCEDYGMPHLPDWDKEIVEWLLSPVSNGDVKIAGLMQQWRRLARNGSNKEKIKVLRKIVNSSSVNDILWKKNLAEAEKKRYAEIEALLPELAGTEDELAKLRDVAAELYSPDLLTPPKESLLNALKEQMLPLQEAEHAEMLDAALQKMQAAYASQNLEELRQCCDRWKQLISNPGVQPMPTMEQKLIVADVEKYIQQQEEEEAFEEKVQILQAELVALLEKNSSFEECNEKYEELLRMEYKIPEALRQQMERHSEEHEELERRRHLRRCIYGVAIAICVLIATVLGIALIQSRNAVNSARKELSRLKNELKFEEGIEFIKKQSPRIASAPAIKALQAELEHGIKERENAINEYPQLEKSLNEMIVSTELMETQEMDSLLERGNAIQPFLPAEQKDSFNEIQKKISQTRLDINRRREMDFIKKVDNLSNQISENEKSITHTANLQIIRQRQQELRKTFERLLSESKVEPQIANNKKDFIEKLFEKTEAAIELEEKNQQLIAKLSKSKDADDFLAILGTYNTMPDFLQLQYAAAFAKLPQWIIDLEDARNFANGYSSGEMAPMEALLRRYGSKRSLFIAEYAQMVQSLHKKHLNDYLAKNRDNFKINEILLKSTNDELFYFYTKNTPELEWDKQYCGRLNYMILADKPENSGRPKLNIFKYNDALNSFTAMTGDFKNTEFKIIDIKEFIRQCRLQYIIDILGTLQSNSQILAATKELLAKLPSSDANPVQLNELYLALLNNIVEIDSLIKQELTEPIQALQKHPFASEEWMESQALTREEIEAQNRIISAINMDKIKARVEFVTDFIAAIRAHYLVPTGTLILQNDCAKFVSFSGKIPREMLVIEKGELHKLFSKCDGSKIEPQDKSLIVNGQLIWGYMDGQTSQEFLEHWRHRAEDNHQTLKTATLLCPKELEFMLN